jgi:hypothetical protein
MICGIRLPIADGWKQYSTLIYLHLTRGGNVRKDILYGCQAQVMCLVTLLVAVKRR